MDQSTIILLAIIGVVLIGVPAVLARKQGKGLTEIMFGRKAKGIFAGTQKKESQDGQSQAGKQTNSGRNDLLDLISRLATFARRNHFRLIVPGTLSCNGTMAVLTALLITRSGVVGINCFGFGGRIIEKSGEENWEQIMNGEEISIPSPVMKNRIQEKLLRQVLEEVGQADAKAEIIGVFTSPSAWLTVSSGANCYTKADALAYLKSDRFLRDGGLDPKALEAALEPRIVRAKNRVEEEKQAAGPAEQKKGKDV